MIAQTSARTGTLLPISALLRKMPSLALAGVALIAGALPLDLRAQSSSHVDFTNDVMPVLRQNCLECHGPKKQKNSLRLDRKSSALKAFARRVVPGNSPNSMVYQRLIGEEYGSQMPPKGPLPAEQIAIIKNWIDQGADWPDSLANEAELPLPDPKAVALLNALHDGDVAAFMKTVQADPALLNARGPEGATPFMYATVYLDARALAKLLKLGVDPNKRNDVNATALIWAARDLEKTRLLVGQGADVNAKSDDNRTPLMVAARRPGSARIVEFLLDHGADPNPNTKPTSESSPLLEALTGGDDETSLLLMKRGADAKATADQGLAIAVMMNCHKALPLIAEKITDKIPFTIALGFSALYGDTQAIRLMLDHGADVNAVDPFGRTALMYAAVSDALPVDSVKLLVERGADVNATSKRTKSGDAGLTILDVARQNGNTPVAEFLATAGAKPGPNTPAELKPLKRLSIRAAVQESLPLLQTADAHFAKNAACASCHNNSMEAMALSGARKRGLRVDEAGASAQVRFNVEALEGRREKMRQGYMAQEVGDMFSEFILGYQLVGLQAENYKPDLNTDAAAILIQSRQQPNGEWYSPPTDSRPPICLVHIGQTALAMRALQLYPPKTRQAEFNKSVRLAAAWLAKVKSSTHEDRCWRLTGLAWAGTDRAEMKKALAELLATQRQDGGWSDLPSMQSSSYATGRALVALHLGGMSVSDPAYKRGVDFLLNTQQKDGSWHTKTRALAFQPYFDGSFPHHYDQWISAAATSWAAMALTLAIPEEPMTAALTR